MPPVDAVLAARSALANTVRYHSGDAEAITAARDALTLAKADRLEADAAALRAGLPADPSVLRIDSYAQDVGVPRELHIALLAGQMEESAAFHREHPNPRKWDKETSDAWDALLASHTGAHLALGCGKNSTCRTARTRGSVQG